MALSGTLRDIGIIDLIQFPHQGRRSGCLEVVGTAVGTAHLYYEQGNLVHAECGGAEGLDALVALVDLEEATFSFDHMTQPPRRTIDVDLHHALLRTLKVRDEQKAAAAAAAARAAEEAAVRAAEEAAARAAAEAAARAAAEAAARAAAEAAARAAAEAAAAEAGARAAAGAGAGARVQATGRMLEVGEQLRPIVERTSWVVNVSIVSPEGDLLLEEKGHPSGANAAVEEVRAKLVSFAKGLGRPMNKMLVERPEGTAMSVTLANGAYLVAFASREAVMGAVVSTVTRMAQTADSVLKG